MSQQTDLAGSAGARASAGSPHSSTSDFGTSTWKLNSGPRTEVRVDTNVLTLRVPLVRVHRDRDGEWFFTGPNGPDGDDAAREGATSSKTTALGTVVDAWPHVAGLLELDEGTSAVWSWTRPGWSKAAECRCGKCEKPVAWDVRRETWPDDLAADRIISVEEAALVGRVPLTSMIFPEGGLALLGPGDHQRTSDDMTPAALANVVRRWPHTMHALRHLSPGRGMLWSPSELSWRPYNL